MITFLSGISQCFGRAQHRKQKHFLVFLFMLALSIRVLLFYAYFGGEVAFGSDGLSYHAGAINLASQNPTLVQVIYNTASGGKPLYMLLLVSLYKIFGTVPAPTVIVQVLLSSGIVVLVYLIAVETLSRRGAYLVAFMAAAYFWEMQWALYVLTETLCLFFVVLTVYLFIKSLTGHPWLYLIGGALALLLSLSARPDNAVFVPGILIWLAFHPALPRPLDRPARVLALYAVVLLVAWPYIRGPLGGVRGAVSLGIQWDIWQQQSRIGGFAGQYTKTWDEIKVFVFQHPDQFLRFAWEKFVATWLLPVHDTATLRTSIRHKMIGVTFFPIATLAVVFSAVSWVKGSILSLVLSSRRRIEGLSKGNLARNLNRRAFSLLLILWLSKTLFIMVTFIDWDFRYRLPVDYIALICVGYLADRIIDFAWPRLSPFVLRLRALGSGPVASG